MPRFTKLRFSLAALFVLMTVCCLAGGWLLSTRSVIDSFTAAARSNDIALAASNFDLKSNQKLVSLDYDSHRFRLCPPTSSTGWQSALGWLGFVEFHANVISELRDPVVVYRFKAIAFPWGMSRLTCVEKTLSDRIDSGYVI